MKAVLDACRSATLMEARRAPSQRRIKSIGRQTDHEGGAPMSSFTLTARLLASAILTSLAWAAPTAPAVAQQSSAPPNFTANQTIGWIGERGNGPGFNAVPDRVPPVADDPAHPFVPNGVGRQPTYRIADLRNPNLKPWVKEHMKKDIDEVLAGKIAFTARSSCNMAGVPGFMAYGGPNPIYFIQTPKQVWIIYSGDQQVRRVYMSVPHLANPKPSWYGESVGHYEGDTLVIDTIGMNTKTVVDPHRTPHTEKLHVVERWRMVDDGKALEVSFTVEDPDTFNEPWSGSRLYRRAQQPYMEEVCAENNQHLFDYHIPVAHKPDF
jgi:hypothetical protein